jgi:Cu(I)/Ag(I) efflux system membrane fusion protein
MASLKIKYAAMIVSSLIAGGLISVTAWQHFIHLKKQKIALLKERSFSGMTR